MKAALTRLCQVEAWASSVGLRYGENYKSNVKDSDLDSLKIKKVYHRTHLKLVDKWQSVEVLVPPKDVTPVYNVQHVDSSVKAAQPHAQSETPDIMDLFPKYEIKAVAIAPVALTRGSHKLKNVESSSPQSGTVRPQPKRNRQYINREKRHRPTGIQVGEVKQMKIGSFPTVADLPVP